MSWVNNRGTGKSIVIAAMLTIAFMICTCLHAAAQDIPLSAHAAFFASQRSPNEVLLVYNSASPTSTAIANYYAAKRGITNVLAINCQDSALNDTNETISFSSYTTKIQTPISTYLAKHSGINFIVLTKGIPIRIDGADTGSENQGQSPQDYQPSLDSYLAALGYSTANGNVKATIAGSGAQGVAWINKYYNSNAPFTHAAFGGYLVTRLDGYTQADATALVDRSLAATTNPATGPILLDVDINDGLGDKTTMPPATPSTNVTEEESYDHGNADLLHTADVLEASGVSTDLAITNTFVGNQSNLLGYFSWGSNDTDYNNNAYESLSFAPGAIANTYVSTSMYSFIGQYVGFNSINLTGMTSLQARVANANNDGNSYIFQIRIDNPSGQVIGTCTVPETGDWQRWTTIPPCNLTSAVNGVHNVYLMFIMNGTGGALYNLQWISFQGVPSVIEAASYNSLSGGEQLESNSEAGQDLSNITNGSYALYSQIRLDNMTSLEARVASAGAGGNIEVHLDSAAGTLIGTCTVPVTGGWQTWTTTTCGLNGASGVHDVYLVFTGGNGFLFNLEWLNFLGGANVIEIAAYNTLSGDESLEPCSEGGQDLGGIFNGQSRMGDLIANGLTGAEGYVNEPTLNGIVGIAFTVNHYESGYTLAESFYAGTPYLGWEGTVVGDPLLAPYYGSMPLVTPTQASSFNGSAGGVTTENNSEGDLDVANISNGSNTYYNNINLASINTFRARVASAGSGGNIQVRLDSATGQLIGTCAVPVTGDWQSWTTVTCGLTGASGVHTVYLVYTGGSGALFNVEWFAFLPSIEASRYNNLSGGEQLENSSEGGQDMGYILSGGYAVYNNINLAGKAHFSARTASAGSGGNIEVHLDSPTGKQIGTCTIPVTGDWQIWATETCSLSGASGIHNVYLVFNGDGGNYLFNLEWFAFN
jgi:uncharacterized protein (TIGR03790 family)